MGTQTGQQPPKLSWKHHTGRAATIIACLAGAAALFSLAGEWPAMPATSDELLTLDVVLAVTLLGTILVEAGPSAPALRNARRNKHMTRTIAWHSAWWITWGCVAASMTWVLLIAQQSDLPFGSRLWCSLATLGGGTIIWASLIVLARRWKAKEDRPTKTGAPR